MNLYKVKIQSTNHEREIYVVSEYISTIQDIVNEKMSYDWTVTSILQVSGTVLVQKIEND